MRRANSLAYRLLSLARKGNRGRKQRRALFRRHAGLLSHCYFAIAHPKRGNIVEHGWFLWHRKEKPPHVTQREQGHRRQNKEIDRIPLSSLPPRWRESPIAAIGKIGGGKERKIAPHTRLHASRFLVRGTKRSNQTTTITRNIYFAPAEIRTRPAAFTQARMSSITSPALERLLSITSDDSFIDRCNSSALSGYGIPESELEKIRQTLSPGFAGGGGDRGRGRGKGGEVVFS